MQNLAKRTYPEAVAVTVNFWVEKAFHTKMNQDNGANGGMMLANTIAKEAQDKLTPEKIEKFKTKLTEILLANEHEGRRGRECDVDYHPNKPLSEACKFAEINSSCLPIKTFTVIQQDNSVTGRYQYGGAHFTL